MDLPTPVYTVLWLVWIVAFVLLEGAAILDKDSGDTLTEHIRKWLALRKDSVVGWMGRGVLLVALTWLLAHFW